MNLDSDTIGQLRGRYGESFYLLDSKQFARNFQELKNAFQTIYPRFNIAYSYKTNYIPKLCRLVNESGGYAEVVSEMELEVAKRVGCAPCRIIWNGPVKNVRVMEAFLCGGGTVNVDSLEEMEVVRHIAQRHQDCMLNVGIRCNYDVGDGVVSRFGFDVKGDAFAEVACAIARIPNIKLVNLQCHFAKRQVEYWRRRAQGMLEVMDLLGIVPERIDIGGGLYGKMADSLRKQFSTDIPSYAEYAMAAAEVFASRFSGQASRPELLIEPGSALVGDCMKFVCTVKTFKEVRGKQFVTVLGSQKNISMTGVNPPMEVMAMGGKPLSCKDADIVGYTCIENDVLYHGYTGMLAHGDVVVFGNCGSYSVVMKPPFILPNFPVLDISGEEVDVVKRGECFEDLFRSYSF